MSKLIVHLIFCLVLAYAWLFPGLWITIITNRGVRKRSFYASLVVIMFCWFFYPKSKVELRRWRLK